MNQAVEATVTGQELFVFSLAHTDALAKLLIENDIITQEEFLAKIAKDRAAYQKMRIQCLDESRPAFLVNLSVAVLVCRSLAVILCGLMVSSGHACHTI